MALLKSSLLFFLKLQAIEIILRLVLKSRSSSTDICLLRPTKCFMFLQVFEDKFQDLHFKAKYFRHLGRVHSDLLDSKWVSKIATPAAVSSISTYSFFYKIFYLDIYPPLQSAETNLIMAYELLELNKVR